MTQVLATRDIVTAAHHVDKAGIIDKVVLDYVSAHHAHFGALRAIVAPDIHEQTLGAYFPGDGNDRLSVPDAANLRITGDLFAWAQVSVQDWDGGAVLASLFAKWLSAGSQMGPWLALRSTAKLRFTWTEDGSTQQYVESTVRLDASGYGLADNALVWIGISADVDNGAGDSDFKFWDGGTGSAPSNTPTQIGSTQHSGSATSFHASTAPFTVGTYNATGYPITKGSWVRRVLLYADLDQTDLRLDINIPVDASQGDTSFVCTTGQTVTINQTGATAADPILHEITQQTCYFPGVASNEWTVDSLANSTAYDYTVTYMDGSTATGEETTDGSGNLVLGGTQSNFDDKYVRSINVYPDGGTGSGDTVAFADFTLAAFTSGMTAKYTDGYAKGWTPGRSASGYVMDILTRDCIQAGGSQKMVVPFNAELESDGEDLVYGILWRSASDAASQALMSNRNGTNEGTEVYTLNGGGCYVVVEDADGDFALDGTTDAYDDLVGRLYAGQWDESAKQAERFVDGVGTGSPSTNASVGSQATGLDLTLFDKPTGFLGADGFWEGDIVAKPAGTNLTSEERTALQEWLENSIPDATQSTATVPAEGEIDVSTSITVQAKGLDGNNMTIGGSTVVVSVTGANTATPTVTDEGDGTYTCSYTPTKAGTDSVAITLDGTAISGSPYTSVVPPNAVFKSRIGVGVGVGIGT